MTKQKERLKEGVGKVAELLDSEIQILKEQLSKKCPNVYVAAY